MGEGPTYKLHWSRLALRDLKDLWSYIAVDNPGVAERFGLALLKRVKGLSEYPKMGSPVPERGDPNIRQLVQRPYRVIYRVDDSKRRVSVLRIWHASRGEPPLRT